VFEIINGLLPASACKYVVHCLCTGELLQDYVGIWTLAKQLIRLQRTGKNAFQKILAELLTKYCYRTGDLFTEDAIIRCSE
jgi:hypothetical protein